MLLFGPVGFQFQILDLFVKGIYVIALVTYVLLEAFSLFLEVPHIVCRLLFKVFKFDLQLSIDLLLPRQPCIIVSNPLLFPLYRLIALRLVILKVLLSVLIKL